MADTTNGARLDSLEQPPAKSTVVIVGAGPAGLFSAYLLAKQNISSIIITRYAVTLGQPKAHAINPRTLEILRQAGFDMSKVRGLGSDIKDAFWVRFNLGLAGHELGKLPYERQDQSVTDVTPEPLINISQPNLENLLISAVEETGLVSIYAGWDWEGLEYESGKPVSLVRNRSDRSRLIEVRSEYVIGADGTESRVRSAMRNVEWASPDGIERPKNHYCSIHASGDLTKTYGSRDRRSQLSFCMHPEHRAGMIIYDNKKSWVHARVINPEEEPLDSFTEEQCRALVSPCVGPEVDFKIQNINFWYTWTRVATDYSDDTQRVHLVGDSAHSFPPQGGLGINTGIADAHNLIWKLGLAIRTETEPTKLLGTYTKERRPVAVANSVQSADNEDLWIEFNIKMHGLILALQKQGGSLDDRKFKQDFETGLGLNKQHYDSLALQIGYIYDENIDPTKLLTDCADYVPSAAVGSRVPHAWVTEKKSTLDLVLDNEFVVFHRGSGFEDLSGYIAKVPIKIRAVDIDEFVVAESWKKVMRLSDGNKAVLVRPDQHVLAHISSPAEILPAIGNYLNVPIAASSDTLNRHR